MPHSVIDLASNTEENLERWGQALKRDGAKLTVWKLIYSTKRRQWTAKEIVMGLNNSISHKRVLTVCRKLVGDTLIHQIPGRHPVVYEKIDDVQHLKSRIVSFAQSKRRRDTLATKRRPKVKVALKVSHSHVQKGRAKELTIDDIDQFSRARRTVANGLLLRPISEGKFKAGLQRLFKDTGRFRDWGGEKNDFFTNKLKINRRRHSAAFALKGPGVGVKTMTPGKWGKQGNQIQRLVETPATVFMLQFEGRIDDYSIDQLKKLVENKATQERRTLYYGYIERDDSLRLRRAYPKQF